MIRLPPRSPPPAPLFPCPTLFRSIQGSLGFGMNLVTVPALALVLPEALPVAVITLGLSISIGMLRHEHHALDRVGLAWILAGRVPGSVVGAWVVRSEEHTSELQSPMRISYAVFCLKKKK